MACVIGGHGVTMFEGSRCQDQIIGPDHLIEGLELGPKPGMFERYRLVIGNALECGEEPLKKQLPLYSVSTRCALCSMPKLGESDCCQLEFFLRQ